jgi:hypothetical protein
MLFMVGVALFDLEPAKVFRRRRVGPAPQERGKASDVADVVALRLRRKPAHGHIVDQALAQRADRRCGNELIHRSAPLG